MTSSLTHHLFLLPHWASCCSLNHLRSFASAVSSAQYALPVICGATFLTSLKSLLKKDLINRLLPSSSYSRFHLSSQCFILHLDLLSTYHSRLVVIYLIWCLDPHCSVHSARAGVFVYFFSLLYAKHPEQCQPHGRIQYFLGESMTACLRARKLHWAVLRRQGTMY